MKKILIVVLMLFLCLGSVRADEKEVLVEAIFLKEPMYYQYKLFDDRSVMGAPGNNLMADGELVYCLEPKILISEKYYKLSDSTLDKEKEKMISLIGYYGFQYKNHLHEFYRVATQHLIWEYLGLVKDVYISSDNTGKNRIDIESYKKEIMTLVDNHSLKPSFSEEKYIAYLGEQLILEDNNKVLNNFIINSKDLNYEIKDNKLLINIDFLETKMVNLSKDLPSRGKNKFYVSGTSQKLMRIGEVVSPESSFVLEVLSGEIEINKLDSVTKSNMPEGKLEGAVYGVYDTKNDLLVELTTDSRGIAKAQNLTLGKYYIKEIIPSEGYLVDENVYEIEITKDNLRHIIVSYEKIYVEPVENFPKIEMPNTFMES